MVTVRGRGGRGSVNGKELLPGETAGKSLMGGFRHAAGGYR